MDYSEIALVYGFAAWFVLHNLFVYCLKNFLAYAYECSAQQLRKSILRTYWIKFIVSGVLFIGATVCAVLVKALYTHYFALMVGLAVACCTTFASVEDKAKRYYAKQAAEGKADRRILWSFLLFLGVWVVVFALALLWRFVW